MTGAAFQMNWPPNMGSSSTYTPVACTGLRMSSCEMPLLTQELKSSTP